METSHCQERSSSLPYIELYVMIYHAKNPIYLHKYVSSKVQVVYASVPLSRSLIFG